MGDGRAEKYALVVVSHYDKKTSHFPTGSHITSCSLSDKNRAGRFLWLTDLFGKCVESLKHCSALTTCCAATLWAHMTHRALAITLEASASLTAAAVSFFSSLPQLSQSYSPKGLNISSSFFSVLFILLFCLI